MTTTERGIDVHWDELVTVALLGTDRRDPPPIDGPIGDVVADAMAPSPAERMLTEVAAATSVRRAAFVPRDRAEPMTPPAVDQRPVCPPAAVRRWLHVVASWPVLEDEWTLTLIEHGWRADPQIVPAMLARHRTDAVRRAHAVAAAGPLAGWLAEHVESLRPAASLARPDRERIGVLPTLPVPPDLADLAGQPGERIGAVLAGALEGGALGPSHRNVLVNTLARVAPGELGAIAAELEQVSPNAMAYGLASSLADLARTRRAMLDELAVPGPPVVSPPVSERGVTAR